MTQAQETPLNKPLRVAIVAEHASAKFGGEAALPLHYFRVLRQRGVDVWLVVHARTRTELSALFPNDKRIHYIEDSRVHLWMWRAGHWLPHRIANVTAGFVMHLATELEQRRIVKRLIRDEGINIVHQPMPVSPKQPTMIYGFGVPVVLGPMNGGIDFPPAFRKYQGRGTTLLLAAARRSANLVNWLMPGKLRGDVLLVANERTRRSLPRGVRGEVIELVENGVDLGLWAQTGAAAETPGPAPVHFLFMGRLVDWKAVDLLLLAFRQVLAQAPACLTIVGDGPERIQLEASCREWNLLATQEAEPGKVYFAGWQSQAECAAFLARASALVLPSLMECGGAVVLEAMAAARPVIATDWGGPADYIDSSCGVLVVPKSPQFMVDRFAAAMIRLAQSPQTRVEMGLAGYQKVVQHFDWEIKIDRMLDIYTRLLAGASLTDGGKD